MRRHERTLQYFFFGQDFADGLRVTLGILLPTLLSAQLGHFELGMTVSLGAVCASLTDIPGPVYHKRNGLWLCAALVLVVALLTGLARLNVWVLGAEILLLCFALTMLLVYGARAGAIGSAGLLVMVLTMDRDLTLPQLWQYAGLVTAGAVWYTLICLVFFRIRPYRPAQRSLGECIHAVAEYLRLKAEFYDPETSLDQDYRRLLQQQVVVNEKLDAARELLFKTRKIVRESTGPSRRLVLTFVDTVDLFEHITAAYYDYAALRQRYNHTGVLAEVARLIRRMAVELDHLGLAIQANRAHTGYHDRTPELEQLKARIDHIGEQEVGSNLVLRKILVQLRNLNQQLAALSKEADPHYDAPAAQDPVQTEANLRRFVTRQSLSPQVLLDNLTMNSATFRHALRVSVAAIIGFVVSRQLVSGHHSYWIVMTTIYMLKPGFSLTKERNIQRVTGTIVGGLIGVAVLWLVPNEKVQFAFLLLFMVTAYSFQRLNYVVMVTFLTPFLLIMFHFLGVRYVSVIEERVLDTVIGCAIALTTGYVLFPRWESEQLGTYMRDVLRANRFYLYRLGQYLTGQTLSPTDYRLARKEVYLSTANLAAAFQRMLSEPKSKQRHEVEVHQFVVLNLVLSSNVATITSALLTDNRPSVPPEALKPVRQSILLLMDCLRKLGDAAPPELEALPALPPAPTPRPALAADERLLLEQLEFVQKVSNDIRKVTEVVAV